MVGLPTNTNMYIPMSDNPSIRKVSIVNFSNNDYELGLNGPAFVMLDMSDLGLSYDIKSTGNGVISKSVKEKDITMKIAINYKPDNYGDPEDGATTYDALTFFLSKLRPKPGAIDRRGCKIPTLPDLCLKWDVPTKSDIHGESAVASRYRDIVITDIQWTEVDKQYQAIILDLTIKPIGPWYYRITTNARSVSSGSSTYATISPTFNNFTASNAKPDMDLFVPFRYGIKMKPTNITNGNQFGSIELQVNNTLETQAFYAYLTTSTSDDGIYMGNLRGVPYIINSGKLTSQNILPGSPLALSPCTNGYLSSIAFNLKASTGMTATYTFELDVPIVI